MRCVTSLASLLAILAALAAAGCSSGASTLSPEILDASRDLRGSLPVFPGAEGFGTDTCAGRGGQLLRVTSLAASGPGTLREALSVPGPRTIVFDVAGVIDIVDSLVIAEPYVSVAGQTAPAPGVTIVGAALMITTHDVLVQHLRIRVGDRPEGPAPDGRDGLGIDGGPAGANYDVYNVVVDHCSVSWAIDEGMSTWNRGVHDITVRSCIISENLDHSLHPEQTHSRGCLIGDHTRRIAILDTLFAHNQARNPFIKGDVSALIANNVIYNPGFNAIHLDDPEGSGPSLATIAGNTLIPGAETGRSVPLVEGLFFTKGATRVYALNNDSGGHKAWKGFWVRRAWKPVASYDECLVRVLPLTLAEPAAARDVVLAQAGARPAERDAVDRRVIDSVRKHDGHIIDSPSEVEGLPRVELVRQVVELPADPLKDSDRDGYTDLEERLHELARRVEQAP